MTHSLPKFQLDIVKDLGNGYILADDSMDDDDGFVKEGWAIYKASTAKPDHYDYVDHLRVSPYKNNRKPDDIKNEVTRILAAAKSK